MKIAAYAFMFLGLSLAVALIAYQGYGEVVEGFAAAGWAALALPAFYLLPLAVFALAWRSLFDVPPRYALLYRGVWTGTAVNWLLPVAQIGGDVLRARLAIKGGVPGRVAGSTILVDKTAMAASQVLYAVIGVALLLTLREPGPVALAALLGVVVLSVLIGLFVWVQHTGMFGFLARRARPFMAAERLERLAGGADSLDTAVRALYAQPGKIAGGLAIRLGARFVAAGEVWLAMQLLGQPVSYAEAVMLESLGQAVRGAMFFVPGALGVQEGGFMILGAVVGIGADNGLVLSLLKRVRELVVGVPALLLWQIQEGRWLAQARRAGAR